MTYLGGSRGISVLVCTDTFRVIPSMNDVKVG